MQHSIINVEKKNIAQKGEVTYLYHTGSHHYLSAKTLIVKLECASNPHEGKLKYNLLGPIPEFQILQV